MNVYVYARQAAINVWFVLSTRIFRIVIRLWETARLPLPRSSYRKQFACCQDLALCFRQEDRGRGREQCLERQCQRQLQPLHVLRVLHVCILKKDNSARMICVLGSSWCQDPPSLPPCKELGLTSNWKEPAFLFYQLVIVSFFHTLTKLYMAGIPLLFVLLDIFSCYVQNRLISKPVKTWINLTPSRFQSVGKKPIATIRLPTSSCL